jgi:hypothetical protein
VSAKDIAVPVDDVEALGHAARTIADGRLVLVRSALACLVLAATP